MKPPRDARVRRVIVIGGGIVGASIAYHLAARGAQVTLIERDQPAGGATGRSFAWINASHGNPRPYFALRVQSLLDYHRLERELGGSLAVNWGGSLLWEVEGQALEDFVAGHRAWGYAMRTVDRAGFRRLEPRVARAPARAVHAQLEGSLDPVAATHALLAGARRHGARTQFDCEVVGLLARGAHLEGVETSHGRLEADCIVLAAGVATQALAAGLDVHLPMRSPAGLLIHTEPVAPALGRVLLAPDLHMRQGADGRLIAGEDFGGGPGAEDAPALAARLLRAIRQRLPDVAGVKLAEVTVGPRPTPGDGMPAIGFAPRLSGLYLAVMHSGITLAPAVGRFAAEEILDGARIEMLAPYRPARFDSQADGPA